MWTTGARKDMRRLDPETAKRVSSAFYRYIDTGHGDVKPLIGRQEQKRLRVGKFRLIFVERDDTLEVVAVLPRDKAYRTREPRESYGTVELSLAGVA
jgi:mRNA-degrading endonuclease RelE of RelBE toxin-antitoxin system